MTSSTSTILVVTPVPPYPVEAGNRARIAEFIELLENGGANVLVFYSDMVPGSTSETSQRLGDRFFFVRFRARSMRRRVRGAARATLAVVRRLVPGIAARLSHARRQEGSVSALESYFDADVFKQLQDVVDRTAPVTILFEYAVWAPYARRLRTQALKIVDTHDRLGDRHIRVATSRGAFSLSVEDEVRALRAFDHIIAIQENEADYFRSAVDKPVSTIGHFIAPHPIGSDELKRSRSIGFIGGNNLVNRTAVEAIFRELWPAVHAACPDAALLIAGTVEADTSRVKGVRRLGVVKNVGEFYRNTRLLLNPITSGTGLKIKVVEALAYGVPVVTTPHGAEGLPSSGAGITVCNSPEEMVAACVRLLTSATALEAEHRNTVEFYADWQSRQAGTFRDLFSY